MRHSAATYAPDGLSAGLSERSGRPKTDRYDRVRGRLADAVLSHLPLAVAVIDRDMRLAYWNAHTAALWGVPPLLAAEHPALSHMLAGIAALSAGQRERLLAFCAEHITCGDRVEPDSWLRIALNRDRRLCIQVTGLGRGMWLLVLNDGRGGMLTDRPTHGGQDAWLDALTGLKNRRQFKLVLEDVLAADTADADGALLLLDVLDLERVNEVHGRAAGDALLCVMARRMERDLREGDTLARFADPGFAILVQSGASGMAERLLDLLSRPYLVEGTLIEASFAIGVAPLSPAADSPAALLDQATAALQAARAQGANRWVCFDPASAAAAESRA